jgi:hypothetical protein
MVFSRACNRLQPVSHPLVMVVTVFDFWAAKPGLHFFIIGLYRSPIMHFLSPSYCQPGGLVSRQPRGSVILLLNNLLLFGAGAARR